MGALNNKFVAGEFPIQSKLRPGNPDQRMKPKPAKPEFVNKSYQVVASFCVCQLVDEDSIEFMLTQHAVNSAGKRDIRMQNPVNSRSVATCSEPYWDAVRIETALYFARVLTSYGVSVDMFSTDPQTKSRKHQSCAKHPHHAQRPGGWTSSEPSCRAADDAQRRRPREMRRP